MFKKNIDSKLLNLIWKNLRSKRKIQLLFILALSLISSISEIFSLSLVIPFLAAIINPNEISNILFFSNIINFLGIQNNDNLILILTVIFVIALVFSSFIRILNIKFSRILSSCIGSDLSEKAFKKIINQPYDYHLNTNSSELVVSITSFVGNTISVISFYLVISYSFLISTSIVATLLYINFSACLTSIIVFSFAYLIFGNSSKKTLLKNSEIIANNNTKLIKRLQETLGLIRDIILDSSQNIYLKNFSKADRRLRLLQADNNYLAFFPKYILEAIGSIFIILFAYFYNLSINPEESYQLIAFLGAFALGLQKLLPLTQQIYTGWASIRANYTSVFRLLEIIDKTEIQSKKYLKDNFDEFTFQSLELKDVSFKFSDSKELILKSVNFHIAAGDILGIVGTTGSGKSTILDILLGLLEPNEGQLRINNLDPQKYEKINLLKALQNKTAHIPQKIYLVDNTIAANIALEENHNLINYKKLIYCAKQAEIHGFVMSTPENYKTYVGEEGIQLSGGQIQRIGIARALYKNPDILIFDEATSALDNETEKKVMRNILREYKGSTLIMVAHRLSTLKKCNKIFEVKNKNIYEIKKV